MQMKTTTMAGTDQIIFFVESPLCERDFNRFGIDLLQSNGFTVKVWNFFAVMHPSIKNDIIVPDIVNYAGYASFHGKKDAQKAISELSESCIIVFLFNYSNASYPLFKMVSDRNLRYCIFLSNILPPVNAQKRPLIQRLKSLSTASLSNRFKQLILNILPPIRPPSFILAGGEQSISGYSGHADKSAPVLWMHTLDYDIYLNERDRPSENKKNFAVFLDEYVPFHPDYVHMGVSPFSSAEEYYPHMRKFFDMIEKELKLNVVIAAHPRSCYEKHPDYFGGREVVRGKTAELVKDSTLVILHSSTAVNYAVLFSKPVVFVTTRRLQQSLQGPMINAMSRELNKQAVSVDNFSTIGRDSALSIDKEAYQRYRNQYIKKAGSQDKPFWQIFADHIKARNGGNP